MSDVLSFDWGSTIVGVLDVGSGQYTPYRFAGMRTGAERVVECTGTVVSFNGNGRDLAELAKILGCAAGSEISIGGTHHDMLELISSIRWPPDPGTAPIWGPSLLETYRHYFGSNPPSPPIHLQDDYEASSWSDCYMTAELWKKWQCGELRP